MFPEAQDSDEGQHVLTRVRLGGGSQARAEAFFPEPRPARTPRELRASAGRAGPAASPGTPQWGPRVRAGRRVGSSPSV